MVSNSQTERSKKQLQPKDEIATHQNRKAALQLNKAIKYDKQIGADELTNFVNLNKVLEKGNKSMRVK